MTLIAAYLAIAGGYLLLAVANYREALAIARVTG